MTIIYGVSKGEYSGYEVAAIFTTREKAEEWIKKHQTACRHCGGTGLHTRVTGQAKCSTCSLAENCPNILERPCPVCVGDCTIEEFPLDPTEIE